MQARRASRHPLPLLFLLVGMAGGWGGCARAPRTAPVAPADIPSLVTQAEQQPRNAAVRFRLAAALAALERCDTAAVVARAAQRIEPDNVRGPLVIGSCEERAGRYDRAIATYNEFATQHPSARGVAALRARAQLALRASAERTAREALAREVELSEQPPEPQTLAVLPLVVAGDSSYQPLSRGLAELITTDLAFIRTLRLLERLQVGVLLDELKLSQSERVDPATAARVGRLLRAERMVQGMATIASPQGSVELSASVVSGAGVVRPVDRVTGSFKQLLVLEKQVVFDLAAQLGIQLTEAERQAILKQGPKNLAAFLAYSRALEALDRGDYRAAARHFRAAAQADLSFQAAEQGRQSAEAAPVVERSTGGDLATVVDALPLPPPAPLPASNGLLTAATRDIVPTAGDVITRTGETSSGTSTIDRQLAPEATGLPSIISVVNGITIIFKRPP